VIHWTKREVLAMRPETCLNLTWDEVEPYVLPEERDEWEEIKKHTTVPFDAIRKLKKVI
jgi:hypothetical protein